MIDRVVLTDRAYISVQTFGHGPTVVLVPGLAGRGSFWDPLIQALQPRFRLLTYDHRGAGLSSFTDTSYSMAAMTADLLQILERCTEPPVMLVGHSTGGAIAQRLAIAHPELVSRLIVASSWAKPCEYFRRLFTLRIRILEGLGIQAFEQHSRLLAYPPTWIGRKPRTHPRQSGDRRRPLEVTILLRKLRALLQHDVESRLNAIRSPTMVAVAADDAVTPMHLSHEIAARIRLARLKVFPGGGHFMLHVHPAAYAAEVARFLAQDVRHQKSRQPRVSGSATGPPTRFAD